VGVRRLGMWLAAAGWASMALMWVTGSAEVFGHDQEGIPAGPAMALFLVGWAVMVAAMMLPSSAPTLARVDRAHEWAVDMAAPRFMAGFFFAWLAFGAAAFTGDQILHLSVANMPWLAERPSLIAGGVAMLAGAAELLGRKPPPLLPAAHEDAGPFSLGKAHAIDRIRRCWPLMLFSMAVTMSSVVWMVALTLVMTVEVRPGAKRALRVAGLALFGLGVTVVVEPGLTSVVFGEL
jgi:predicted metal-binding membrane protein